MRRIQIIRLALFTALFFAAGNSLYAQELIIEANEISSAEFQPGLSAKFKSWNTYMLKKTFSTPSLQTKQVRLALGNSNIVFTGNHHPLTDSKSKLVTLTSNGRTEQAFPQLLYLNSSGSRLTVGDNFILGETVDNGEVYLLENLRNIDPSAPENMLIRYKKSDVIADKSIICAAMPNNQMTRQMPEMKNLKSVGLCRTVEIAVLANSSSYALHSNSLITTASYIASIYNLTEGDYQGQFTYDLQFRITELVVSVSTQANPWPLNDDIYTNLNNFNISGGSYFRSPNDLSAFWFNTKNFTGGVVGLAYLGYTCTTGGDAAIREYGSSAQSMRCLVSHEHGHNFSMDHDASGAPFIMAPSVGSANVDFSPASINSFQNWFSSGRAACITDCDTASCDGSAPDQLNIVSNSTTGNINASWVNEPGLKGYIIRWKEKSQAQFTADTLDADADSYSIVLGCQAKRNYRAEVAKICKNGSIGEFRGVELVNLAIPLVTTNKPSNFCAGGDVTLVSSIGTGNQWYKDNKIISGATERTYLTTVSGVYTVRVTSGGCTRISDPLTVTVTAFPAKPAITVTGGTVVCTGVKVTLTSSAGSGNQWFKNGVTIGGATSRTYLPTATATYTVKTTNAGGCATLSNPVTITVNPVPAVPTVTAGGVLKLCPGTSVTLTSSAASANQWYKDNILIAGAVAKTYKITAAGSYSVKVKNSSGCISTSLITKVTYSDNPPKPVITAGGPLNICAGGTVVLTSSSTSGNQWLKDGVAITGALSRTYKVTLAGKYSVRVTNAGGCFAVSSTVSVIVYALPVVPVVTPAGPLTICPGTEITLVSASAATYQWYKNNIVITGATAKSYKANATGRYTVVVGNGYGCKATSLPVSVTLGTNPAKPVVKANGPLSICAGKNVVLTSNTSTGNQWYKDGRAMLDSTGKSIRVSVLGKYLLKVTNAAGCSSVSDTFEVKVNAIPALPRVTPYGPIAFCSGKETTLTSNAASGNQWYKNEILIAGATAKTLLVNSTGNYKVVVTNASGCTNVSAVVVVTVNPLPAIPVITAAGSLTLCTGNKVILTSNSDNGNQWLKNGAVISGATAKTFEASAAAQYSVKVTNAGNCFSVSAPVTVVVNPAPAKPSITRANNTFSTVAGLAGYAWYKNNVLIAGATTNTYITTEPGTYKVGVTAVNGCSTLSNDYVLSAPATSEHGIIDQYSLRAYPNPARDYIQIRFDAAVQKKCTLLVYDRFGKLVINTVMKGSVHQLSTSAMAAGVYNVVVSDGTRTVSAKIVIAR